MGFVPVERAWQRVGGLAGAFLSMFSIYSSVVSTVVAVEQV